MLGDFDLDAYSDTSFYYISVSLLVIYIIVVTILLLNLLIAMMGDTYGNVIEGATQIWWVEVLNKGDQSDFLDWIGIWNEHALSLSLKAKCSPNNAVYHRINIGPMLTVNDICKLKKLMMNVSVMLLMKMMLAKIIKRKETKRKMKVIDVQV